MEGFKGLISGDAGSRTSRSYGAYYKLRAAQSSGDIHDKDQVRTKGDVLAPEEVRHFLRS
jgi:hypothetical protein